MKHLVICLVLFLFSYSLAVADFSGPVVSVLDGDTIDVLHSGQAERIRLNGIDAPGKINPTGDAPNISWPTL